MAKRAKYPWEERKITYAEWGVMDFDWENQYKINNSIPSYFFRYDNYYKGLENEHIMKSTFGRKTMTEIKAEIKSWYNACVGAYTKIEYN